MKINEVIMQDWIIMPSSIDAMGLKHLPGSGPNNRFDFKNKDNNRANEEDLNEYSVVQQRPKIDVLNNIASRKDPKPFPLSYKDTGDQTASTGGMVFITPDVARRFIRFYDGQDKENQELMQKALKSASGTANLFKNLGLPVDLKKAEMYNDAAGVGIITKQNTTKDVKPGDEYKNVKKLQLASKEFDENFADGKKPGRKGLSKRVGIPKGASVSQLRKIAKNSTGERRRMAHWQANMKAGKKK